MGNSKLKGKGNNILKDEKKEEIPLSKKIIIKNLSNIKNSLKNIKEYIQNEIKEKYLNAERNLLNINKEKDNDLNKELNQYNLNLENYIKSTMKEILKYNLFEKLNNSLNKFEKINIEIYESFMNIYYLIYLSENLDIKNDLNEEHYIKILQLMLNERYNTNNEDDKIDFIGSISKKIIWMESYKNYLLILFNTYRNISKYEKNIECRIKKLIKDKKIILTEDLEKNPFYTRNIKSPFYCMIQALLIISIEIILYNNLNEEEFNLFINSLKKYFKEFLIIYQDLSIFSKEIFIIKEFLEIEEQLTNENKNNKNNFINILQALITLSKIDNQENKINLKEEDIVDNLKHLYNLLFDILGNTENFKKLIINIFVSELKQTKNYIYKQIIIKFILKNNNLIPYLYQVLSVVLESYLSSNPIFFEKNIKNIQEDKTHCLNMFNNSNNDIFNEILISIFEKNINIYFESIPYLEQDYLKQYYKLYYEYKKDNKGKINSTLILLDKSLSIFKDCINILESLYEKRKKQNEDNINNALICELYSISYIKIYIYLNLLIFISIKIKNLFILKK